MRDGPSHRIAYLRVEYVRQTHLSNYCIPNSVLLIVAHVPWQSELRRAPAMRALLAATPAGAEAAPSAPYDGTPSNALPSNGTRSTAGVATRLALHVASVGLTGSWGVPSAWRARSAAVREAHFRNYVQAVGTGACCFDVIFVE